MGNIENVLRDLVNAVKENKPELVREILNNNENMIRNPTLTDHHDSYTVMHSAAMNGFVDVMAALLSAEPDHITRGFMLEATGGECNWTPLHVAANAGQTEAVRWLLKQNVNPNQHGGSKGGTVGTTPLSLAAYAGHHGVVKLLLSNNVPTSSFKSWDLWFEKHGLSSAKGFISEGENRHDQLALILGYAVLQSIERSLLSDYFISDDATATRDSLKAILKGIEEGHINADETIGEAIQAAMVAWGIGSGKWSELSDFLNTKPFSLTTALDEKEKEEKDVVVEPPQNSSTEKVLSLTRGMWKGIRTNALGSTSNNTYKL